jgi:hypothetical protein
LVQKNTASLKTQFGFDVNRGSKTARAKMAAFLSSMAVGNIGEMWFGPTRFKGGAEIFSRVSYPPAVCAKDA